MTSGKSQFPIVSCLNCLEIFSFPRLLQGGSDDLSSRMMVFVIDSEGILKDSGWILDLDMLGGF